MEYPMDVQNSQKLSGKRLEKILKYSAELGHYIGDAHVPLHTTENYNGQLTNRKVFMGSGSLES